MRVFDSIISGAVSLTPAIMAICTITSLIIGVLIAYVYKFDETYSRQFVMTLVVLPTLVQMVIMMVNGNLGTSVAVLGTFGLVRFRSLPGSSKDICFIFFAMAVGLATGMGYIGFAVVIAVIVSLIILVLSKSSFIRMDPAKRDLHITIPENLDYTEIFNDLFERYTFKAELERVKTTHLGSMYELRYVVVLKEIQKEKEFLDELRCRNGNLTIVSGRIQNVQEEL